MRRLVILSLIALSLSILSATLAGCPPRQGGGAAWSSESGPSR